MIGFPNRILADNTDATTHYDADSESDILVYNGETPCFMYAANESVLIFSYHGE
jgi:hypothetical protein